LKFKSTLAAGLLVATAFTSQASAQEVTLRAVSAFNLDTTFSREFQAFVGWINENGKGTVQIDLIGGPEAVPPFELGNAVQSGVVDMANNTAAFYPNLVPTGDAIHLAENTVQEQRENGCYAVIDRIHQEQMNVKYLAHAGDGIGFHLYLTKPVEGPDLSGLTIRTTPVYQAMFSALGANLVRTAPGEVYSALERGAIDGYGWPSQGVLDLGWDEQTKYRVDPSFYNVDVNLLVNLDVWNGLTDAQRAKLEEGAAWMEALNANNAEINTAEYAKQAEAGIETITFDAAGAEKWLTTARDAGWAAVEAVDKPLAQELRACLSK
jgi:TRAP-type C4-dicarboxylate transport system substrate-binding protein